MRVNYGTAQAENSRRPTCIICYAPCGYDREYKSTHLCQTCYDESTITTYTKELLHHGTI